MNDQPENCPECHIPVETFPGGWRCPFCGKGAENNPPASVVSIDTANAVYRKQKAELESQLADLTRQRDEAVAEAKLLEACRIEVSNSWQKAEGELAERRTLCLRLATEKHELSTQLEAETKARVEAELAHETDTGRLKGENATWKEFFEADCLLNDIDIDHPDHEATVQRVVRASETLAAYHPERLYIRSAIEFAQREEDARVSKLATLTARVAELEADRERLDIIEKAFRSAPEFRDLVNINGFKICVIEGGFFVAVDSFTDPIIDGCDLRAAIDAARSAQPEGGV